jgi:hypothetical protein
MITDRMEVRHLFSPEDRRPARPVVSQPAYAASSQVSVGGLVQPPAPDSAGQIAIVVVPGQSVIRRVR